MGVNSAVGKQSEQVKCAAVLLAVINSGVKSLVAEEVAVLNGLGYSCKFLINDPSCTDIGVT